MAQERAWKLGFVDYHNNNGVEKDYRGKADYWAGRGSNYKEYLERDPEVVNKFGDVVVLEPCNTSSNIAYYRSVTRLCSFPEWHMKGGYQREFKRVLAQLGAGSFNMHASHTNLGHKLDARLISFFSFLLH